MAFTKLSDITNSINIGQKLSVNYYKNTSSLSISNGIAANLFTVGGNPISGTYSGSLQGITCDNSTTGSIYTGNNVSPLKKHIINMEINSGSSSGPVHFLLVDILAYYNGFNLTSLNRQLTDSISDTNILPLRDGVQHTGKNAFMFLESSDIFGYGYSTCSIEYTEVTGQTGISNLPYLTTASSRGTIIHTSSPQYPTFIPFIPLCSNHRGISSIQALTMNIPAAPGISMSSTTPSGTLVICEPIMTMPYIASGVPSARDLIYNKPSFPRIKDNSCLAFILIAGATITPASYQITMDLVWG